MLSLAALGGSPSLSFAIVQKPLFLSLRQDFSRSPSSSIAEEHSRPHSQPNVLETAAIVLETRRTNNKNPIYNLTRRVRKQQFFFFEPDGPPAAGNFPPMMPDIIPSTTGRDSLE